MYKKPSLRKKPKLINKHKRIKAFKKLRGFILICFLYVYYYYTIVKYFSFFSSLVLKNFFKMKNFTLFFPLSKNNSIILFFNFLIFFDKYYIFFFNFFLLYSKLSRIFEELYWSAGFFVPINRLFIAMEVFDKVDLNNFTFDFFSFNDLNSPSYKYVILYNEFILKMDILSFLFLFKSVEAIRVIKYNEYICTSSFLFAQNDKRYLFIKSHGDLYSAYLICYRWALCNLRFVVFNFRILMPECFINVTKSLTNIYKNNKFLVFLSNISKYNSLNRCLSFIFGGFLDFYLFVDMYKALFHCPILVEMFRRLTGLESVPDLIYRYKLDIMLIFSRVKYNADFISSYFISKDLGVCNFHFYMDLIHNNFSLKYFFFIELLDVVFCDFNECFLMESNYLETEISNAYLCEHKYIKSYKGNLIFFFFEMSIMKVEYSKWFFCFEYFFWRIMHVDYSFKFDLDHYIHDNFFDFLIFNRHMGNVYLVQKLMFSSKKQGKSLFFLYYIFILYRDIILKAIIFSFDINLLFYFLYKELFYFDNIKLLSVMYFNSGYSYLAKILPNIKICE